MEAHSVPVFDEYFERPLIDWRMIVATREYKSYYLDSVDMFVTDILSIFIYTAITVIYRKYGGK